LRGDDMEFVYAVLCSFFTIGVAMCIIYAQDGKVILKEFKVMWLTVYVVVYTVFSVYFILILN